MPGDRLQPAECSGRWVVTLAGRRVRIGSELEFHRDGRWRRARVTGGVFARHRSELRPRVVLEDGGALDGDEAWTVLARWPKKTRCPRGAETVRSVRTHGMRLTPGGTGGGLPEDPAIVRARGDLAVELSQAWMRRGVQGAELAVLAILCHDVAAGGARIGDEIEVFTTRAGIAARSGYSRDSARRGLRGLRARGAVERRGDGADDPWRLVLRWPPGTAH